MSETINDMADDLLAIADMGNELLGRPTCNETCEHGGRCTLDTDHDGDHEAWGSEIMHCSWEVSV